jgi:1-acyl-sn-glycerol-3-phosphate acyltransferase
MEVIMILLRVLASLWYWFVLIFLAPIFYLACLTALLVRDRKDPKRKWIGRISCVWGSAYLWCNPFWRIRIVGREKLDSNRTTVYICNHQSSFDIYLLFRLFFPFQWVTKKSNFYVPFIGWNMRHNRSIGFERGDRRETLRMVKECVKRLLEGISLIIFPEGERTPDGRMQPFLGGAFAIAKRAEVPIQPMVLTGTYDVLPRYKFLVKAWGTMTLAILDPIPLDTVKEKSTDELKDLAWRRMAEWLPPEALPENWTPDQEVPSEVALSQTDP